MTPVNHVRLNIVVMIGVYWTFRTLSTYFCSCLLPSFPDLWMKICRMLPRCFDISQVVMDIETIKSQMQLLQEAQQACLTVHAAICDGHQHRSSSVFLPSVTRQPVTCPPVTRLLVNRPSVTHPPVTHPPVTHPPVTHPPVSKTSGSQRT